MLQDRLVLRPKSSCAVPAPPGTKRVPHDKSLILLAEPRQLLGKHRHALAPGARHLGDVRTPEHSVRTKGVIDLPQKRMQRWKRVGLTRLVRHAGRLDRHVGELRQCHKLRDVSHRRGIL